MRLALALPVALLACGNQTSTVGDDAQALAQLQEELHQANAVIDSLKYTVDASNQIIDCLRAQVSSLQEVDARLYESVQQLYAKLRNWRTQAENQREQNQEMSAELERLRREKHRDRQTIARVRREADSLNSALLDANGALRRQVGHLDQLRDKLALARGEAAQAVQVFPAGEQSLREPGYMETGRKMFRKSYELIKPLDPADPRLRPVPMGQPLELEGDLRGLADRYGRLREGSDFAQEKLAGRVRVTFTNPLLQGSEVVAVVGN